MVTVKALAAIALTLMVAVPIGLGYGLASAEETVTNWETESTTNVSELLLNNSMSIYEGYTGTSNNLQDSNGLPLDFVSTSANPSSYPFYEYGTEAVTFTQNHFVTMPAYSWTVTIPANTNYYYDATGEMDDDDVSGSNVSHDNKTLTYTGGQLMIQSTTLTLNVTSYWQNGYADVADGWKITTSPSQWVNDQTNKTVTLIVNMPDNDTIKIGNTIITRTSGVVTAEYDPPVPTPDPIETLTLGTYQYLKIVFGANVEIYGLADWPAVNSTPTTFNHITIENGGYSSDFTFIRITDADLDAIFRVESSESVAGTYPITKNLTFDGGTTYPDKSYTFKFNSIALYGGSLGIVDGQTSTTTTYTVTDGKITVDGKQVAIKGLNIKVILENNTWSTYIGNYLLYEDRSAGPQIYFGGEWSLTASINLLAQTTETRQSWAPGEFAFDKEDFAACGLIVAGVAMIGLGMTGAKSGFKMGLLLLVCGGGALIYLTVI